MTSDPVSFSAITFSRGRFHFHVGVGFDDAIYEMHILWRSLRQRRISQVHHETAIIHDPAKKKAHGHCYVIEWVINKAMRTLTHEDTNKRNMEEENKRSWFVEDRFSLWKLWRRKSGLKLLGEWWIMRCTDTREGLRQVWSEHLVIKATMVGICGQKGNPDENLRWQKSEWTFYLVPPGVVENHVPPGVVE